MSKRPLSTPPTASTALACLDFYAWKIQQASTSSIRRDDDTIYDPSIEALPDHVWYGLDQQSLHKAIVQTCDELGRPVVESNIDDPKITDFLQALGRAKTLPRPKKVSIAIVGNQGVGKSSVINSLLNRDLVDASASSSACTAFATIIQYKEGALDHTDESDLKVTFLEIEEIRDFVEEHIRRYADVYVPNEHNVKNEVESETIKEEQNTPADPDADDLTSDADLSDSDFSDPGDNPVVNKKKRKKVSKAMQASADTAEQFFRIIFNARSDDAKEAELQDWLDKPGLENGRFLDHCVAVAKEHLAQIHAEEEGRLEYTNVNDVDLQKMRDHATQMWPLVKAVTISTGSVLLRNGIRFMDLPGYGDLNQTRSAVVNEYRRKANFEMVVARSDRYLSKTDEDSFLNRAIRHHEAKNVFLVLNKIDSCLETPQHQVIRMLNDEVEEPFVTINQRLSGLKDLKGEPRSTLQRYRKYLIREAQMAAGRRECDKIRHKMQRKGVQVFSVSSARYFDWLDPSPLEDPPFDAQGTGIPLLRRSLLMLPAEANYNSLRHHILETAADVEDKVSRILMTFTNDVDVACIRRRLLEDLPILGSHLRELAITVPRSLITDVWTEATKREIADSMKSHLKTYIYGDVAYQTFWHLLRNNGFATHGKCKSKNLNNELLQTYKSTIKKWRYRTSPKVKDVIAQLNTPVSVSLGELGERLQAAASDPELKRLVAEALQKLARRIEHVRDGFSEQLNSATMENYTYFTTEDDIKCPIALELKTAYTRINMIRMDEWPKHRKGIYKDQRAELIRTVTIDNNGKVPLVDAISAQVKRRQCKLWQAVEEEFIVGVLGHFDDFAKALAELLEDETYMLEAHRLMRARLAQQLIDFSKKFTAVKDQFPRSDAQRDAKRACIAGIKEEVVD